MIISIIAIGNSKGIRLPKSVLEQLNISDKVEMEVENQQIILKPVEKKTREGWDKAFQEMHNRKEDALVLQEESNEYTFEWEW